MTQKQRNLIIVAITSGILAILTHGYLSLLHYRLKSGMLEGKSLCSISDTLNCEAVAASSYSEFLGVPLALWGLIANSVLVCFLITSLVFSSTDGKIKSTSTYLNYLIFAASIIMGIISLTLLSTYCVFCIATYLFSIVSFFTIHFAFGKIKFFDIKQDLFSLIATSFAILILGFLINYQFANAFYLNNQNVFVRQHVVDWQQEVKKDLKLIEPIVTGSDLSETKMLIQEFADFRCSHCKHAAPVLNAFVKSHPGVRLEFQTWPLDGECNTSIDTSNGISCMLARLAYCSEKINQKGKQVSEYLFENQSDWRSLEAVETQLSKIESNFSLPEQSLKPCVDAKETKDIIIKQAQIGSDLKIKGTPTFYVNGKLLQAGQNLSVLKAAYKELK